MSTDGVASERCLFTGSATGITTGSDGNLWIASPSLFGGLIRIDPVGSCSGITLPTPPHGRSPQDIVAGPDGAIWFTEPTGNQIGRWKPAPFPFSSLTLFDVPTFGSGVSGIASGPDGALWFTEQAAGKIGRIMTTGVFSEYTLPSTSAGPVRITAGPDGALWFTEQYGKIGRITTAGVITEFAIPTAPSGPHGITAGPDGALWFTELFGDKIGRVTTLGEFTEFALTPGSGPVGITSGPDGNIWFTEQGRRLIGRLTLVPADVTPPVIRPTVTPTPNASGWNNTDVTVTWSATDPESGIATSSGCDTTAIADATSGTTLTCTARNGTGLSTTQSVVIRIDKTAPTIIFSGNTATYTVDQTILITCAASDALSGIAVTSCPTVAAGPATNYVGTTATTSTTVSATATDNAGNSAAASTTFTVTVTAAGICRLSAPLATADDICTKAASIATAPTATAKAGKLGAFDNFLAAQSGRSIPADLATLLSVLAHLL